jgi:hypothetical protein
MCAIAFHKLHLKDKAITLQFQMPQKSVLEILPGFILDLQGMMGAIAPASATLSSCSIAQKASALLHIQVIYLAIIAHHL